jgi:hypothetical protein
MVKERPCKYKLKVVESDTPCMLLLVLLVLSDVEKSYVNAGMPEKSKFCFWYHWSRISSILASYGNEKEYGCHTGRYDNPISSQFVAPGPTAFTTTLSHSPSAALAAGQT